MAIYLFLALAIFLQRDFFIDRSFENFPFVDGFGLFYRGIPLVALIILVQTIFVIGLVDWKNIKKRIHLDLLLFSIGMLASFLLYAHKYVEASILTFLSTAIYVIFVLSRRSFCENPESLSPSLPSAFFWIFSLIIIPIYIFWGLAFSPYDIGYAGVVGADFLTQGKDLYGGFPKDIALGDTYGPLNYWSYVPFEAVFPWNGSPDGSLESAKATSIFFFLITLIVLFFLGKRFYSKREGIIFVFAFLSFPINIMPLYTSANDMIPLFFMLLVFLVAGKPALKGLFAGASAMTKWFSLLLVPLFSKLDERGISALKEAKLIDKKTLPSLVSKKNILYWVAFFLVAALLLFDHLLSPGIPVFLERAFAYQVERESPWSLWWYIPKIEFIVKPLLILFIVSLATGIMLIRQSLSVSLVAALAAILLLLFQITLNQWYFTYFVWVFPFIILALFVPRKS